MKLLKNIFDLILIGIVIMLSPVIITLITFAENEDGFDKLFKR